ncbi:unnamed protein product [Blepharisma stoltei]|uniref:Endonuclease/exonuclease/phosphatase domain-containing protein n=1 Tax=Blepharisma stoltei TaxID=1481888 RepID=A0AAU9JQM9_9CILI|nr:unnamed protein product [Blepharisma stoltei]
MSTSAPTPDMPCMGNSCAVENALDLPDEIMINGRKIWLNHAASLFCEKCGKIGHNEKGHDAIVWRKAERLEKGRIKREKREEERKMSRAAREELKQKLVYEEQDNLSSSSYIEVNGGQGFSKADNLKKSAASVEQVAPEDHAAPVEHIAPVGCVTPAEHVEPVEHVAPVKHVAPVEQAAPIEHAAPVEHVVLVEHVAPVERETPVEQETLVEHAAPEEHTNNAGRFRGTCNTCKARITCSTCGIWHTCNTCRARCTCSAWNTEDTCNICNTCYIGGTCSTCRARSIPYAYAAGSTSGTCKSRNTSSPCNFDDTCSTCGAKNTCSTCNAGGSCATRHSCSTCSSWNAYIQEGKRSYPWADGDEHRRKRICVSRVLTVGHVNVYGVNQKGEQLREFIEEHNLDILGIYETYLKEKDKAPYVPGYNWYHSPAIGHSAGVAFIYRNNLELKRLLIIHDSRIIGLMIGDFVIIEAYCPVENAIEEELEDFYEKLNIQIGEIRAAEQRTLVLGDFNAHVAGWYSGTTNQNGKRLIKFCKEWQLKLMSLDKPTHTHSSGNVFCLDYCATDWDSADTITDFDTCPGNPIKSDHLPLIVKILAPVVRKKTPDRKRIRTDRLQSRVYLNVYQKALHREIGCLMAEEHNSESLYNALVNGLLTVGGRVLGKTTRLERPGLGRGSLIALRTARRHKWKAFKAINAGNRPKYLEEMKKHRAMMKEFKHQLKQDKQSSRMKREIEWAVIGAKDEWELVRRIKRARRAGPVKFTSGEEGKILDWWKYQYQDSGWDQPGHNGDPLVPTKEEVSDAIKQLGNRKAVGPDNLPAELIKGGGELVETLCINWYSRYGRKENSPRKWTQH